MKNETPSKFIALSEDFRYIFTDKGVAKMSFELNDLNGRNFVPYTYEHLNVAASILKENFDFKYKVGKISLNEYTTEPRKFLTFFLETFQLKNSSRIIQEWESRFGNNLLLINESVDNLIIEQRVSESWSAINIILEQWYNPLSKDFVVYQGAKNVANYVVDKGKQAVDWGKEQVKQIGDKGLVGWAVDKAKNVWNYVKDKLAAAWNCIKAGVECIMEGMRSMVMSATGTAILTGVSIFPVVGQVTNAIIFGALLIWDLYLMAQGKGDWINIIVDALGLLLPAASKIFKTAAVGIKSFSQFGAQAAAKGGILAKVFNVFKNGLTTLGGYITKAATFLGEKLGITSLANWGKNATAKLANISDDMVKGAKGGTTVTKNIATKGGSKVATKVGTKAATTNATPLNQIKQIWARNPKAPIPPAGVVISSMGKTFVITAAICAALGLDGVSCASKAESGELTPEQVKAAQEKADKEMATAMAQDNTPMELDIDPSTLPPGLA